MLIKRVGFAVTCIEVVLNNLSVMHHTTLFL